MKDVEGHAGLSSSQVEELRQKHGFNEVKTKPVPEWKKLLRRYTDWISIIIVRAKACNGCLILFKCSSLKCTYNFETRSPLVLRRLWQLSFRLLFPMTVAGAGPALCC